MRRIISLVACTGIAAALTLAPHAEASPPISKSECATVIPARSAIVICVSVANGQVSASFYLVDSADVTSTSYLLKECDAQQCTELPAKDTVPAQPGKTYATCGNATYQGTPYTACTQPVPA
ncbi:hypothetical protein AGRA3207_000523 [Actinomadura graeca]|uniref:Secreted protein n=1 Tax=Actinomadura graeca TaxID=2750812 RepID=A0ABX8QQ87_9ACTN|nr:hypothetical protein [Actinomadura graeca]QXJ19912.1 hypothetical protein AGRA3207_000523 [Actinomadura graeca]